MKKKQVSALILAAGLSERMGSGKFALEIREGVTFLEHIARLYDGFGCRKIVVILNPKGKQLFDNMVINLPAGVEILNNHFPERGRFYSIKTGLAPLRDEELVFLQNIDSPMITEEVLNALLNNSGLADTTYPVYQGRGGHPVLFNKKLVQTILDCGSDENILKDYLGKFKSIQTPVNNPDVLININTEADYHELLRHFSDSKPTQKEV